MKGDGKVRHFECMLFSLANALSARQVHVMDNAQLSSSRKEEKGIQTNKKYTDKMTS